MLKKKKKRMHLKKKIKKKARKELQEVLIQEPMILMHCISHNGLSTLIQVLSNLNNLQLLKYPLKVVTKRFLNKSLELIFQDVTQRINLMVLSMK